MKGNMKQTDANKLVEQSFLKVFRRYKGTYSQNDVEEIMKADHQALRERFEKELLGAIARGWCHKETEREIMNPELAKAIEQEVLALLKGKE